MQLDGSLGTSLRLRRPWANRGRGIILAQCLGRRKETEVFVAEEGAVARAAEDSRDNFE